MSNTEMKSKKKSGGLTWLLVILLAAVLVLTMLDSNEHNAAQAVLNDQIADLETENATLTEQLAAVTSELDAAKAAAIDSDLALAEANGRLEQAETALSDMLAVVQLIREELNGAAAEEEAVAEEEAPAEEVTEAVEAEEVVAEEVPAEEVTEAVEAEEPVTEEVPAEETTDEAAAPEEAA